MKNFVREFLYGRNAKMNFLLILTIVSLVGLGCFGSSRSNAKPIAQEYHGDWQGSDGSTLRIRPNSSGDFKQGGFTVDNATVQLDETGKVLQLTFFGVSTKDLRIDQAPSGDTMKLDGITFKRTGGATTTSTTTSTTPDNSNKNETKTETVTKKADASKTEIPEDAELQQMAKRDLLAFNDAVQQGDFAGFHSKISRLWQKQTTPERFNQAFGQFIEKKIDISDINSETAEFSPAPYIEKEGSLKKLIVEGKYPTYAPPVKFILKYIPEGKEWKLFGIEVDTTGN